VLGADNDIVNLAKGSTLQAESFDAFFSVSVRDYLGDEEVMKAFMTLIRASTPKVYWSHDRIPVLTVISLPQSIVSSKRRCITLSLKALPIQ
jgi:hypothetical protein